MTPRIITVGQGALLVTSLDFLNGYQAGHLSSMAAGRAVAFSDEELITLLMEKLESLDSPERSSVGYVVGWIATFACKGPQPQEGGPSA